MDWNLFKQMAYLAENLNISFTSIDLQSKKFSENHLCSNFPSREIILNINPLVFNECVLKYNHEAIFKIYVRLRQRKFGYFKTV